MKTVRKDKPHITFVNGWWKVSPMPKPYHSHMAKWRYAYQLTHKLNQSNN